MPDGIIYIARNNSNPENHYKIGKSYKADPIHRMRELTSETTNYEGEYQATGYVLVSDVDNCERIIHKSLSSNRIHQRREFFNIHLNEAIKSIRSILKDHIIKDELYEIDNNDANSDLEYGDYRLFNESNSILRFVNIDELQSLNFFQVCKFADHYNWPWDISCHGGGCLSDLNHAFFVLINKLKFIQKYSEDQNFTPNILQTKLEPKKVSNKDSLKLQNFISDINFSEYFTKIKFPNNLGYIGVVMNLIGEEIERENKKITKFLIPNFKKIFPNQYEMIEELDRIYYSGDVINCWKLSLFEKMILASNDERFINNKRYI